MAIEGACCASRRGPPSGPQQSQRVCRQNSLCGLRSIDFSPKRLKRLSARIKTSIPGSRPVWEVIAEKMKDVPEDVAAAMPAGGASHDGAIRRYLLLDRADRFQ